MVESNKELEKMSDKEGWTLIIATNCAHIFAESINKDISGASEGSSTVRFSPITLQITTEIL